MDYDADDAEFVGDDVETIVKNVIDQNLKDAEFNPKKLDEQSGLVVDSCIKGLLELNRPFKYAVTCIIMQKNGAGLHTSATCFWDTKSDGYCTVPWENNSMHCIVTVYGMAITPSNQEGE